MGVPGLMIPEEYGGAGLKVLEASLVAEQLGSYAVPSPWIGNSIMAPTAILFDRENNLAEKWLPLIASGEISACVSLSEVVGKRSDLGLVLDSTNV